MLGTKKKTKEKNKKKTKKKKEKKKNRKRKECVKRMSILWFWVKNLFFLLELLLNALLFSLVLTCYYLYCSLPSPYKFHYNLFERPLDFCNLFDLSSGELMYMQAYGKILS